MANRVWSAGPFACKLRGNLDVARGLVRLARVRAGYLLQRLLPGQTYSYDTYQDDEGSIIHIHVWRDVLGERVVAKIFGAGMPGELILEHRRALCYHGWLGWYPEGYPGKELPPTVWVDGSLADYFAFEGTAIPNTGSSPKYQHLFGRAQAAIGRSCHGKPAPDWPFKAEGENTLGNPPELADDLSYLWPFPAPRLPVDHSQIWIGEARGMDQALRGVARKWADVLPTEWSQLCTETAIFWSPKGELWAAQISDYVPGFWDEEFGGKDEVIYVNGKEIVIHKADPLQDDDWQTAAPYYTVTVKLVRLSVPRILLCVLRWLQEERETLTKLDCELLKAYCYANAFLADDEIVRTLVVQEAHSPTHTVIGAPIHPLTNWQPYWQPDVDSPTKIVKTISHIGITPGSSTKQRKPVRPITAPPQWSRTITITILWNDEDMPYELKMDVTRYKAWGAKEFQYWYPNGNGLEVELTKDESPDNSGPIDVYSFTAADGYCYTLTKEGFGMPKTYEYGTGLTWPNICGTGTETTKSGDQATGIGGGWTVTGGPSQADAKIVPITGGTYDTRVVKVDKAESISISWPPDTESGVANLHLDTAYICEGDYYEGDLKIYETDPDQNGISWTIDAGNYEIKRESVNDAVGTGYATMVLLPTDNGVFVGSVQEWEAGYRTIRGRKSTYTPDVSYSGILLGWEVNTLTKTYIGTAYNGAFHYGPYAFGSKFSSLMSGYNIGDGPILEQTDLVNLVEAKCYLVTSGISRKTVKYEDWRKLFVRKSSTPEYAPLVLATWRGDVIYTESYARKITNVPEGLSLNVLTAPNLAPIGAV